MKWIVWLACSGMVLLAGCTGGAKRCAVCARDECPGVAFQVTLENGKVVETCCPRCGLHYLHAHDQQARTMRATDFATGEWIDATRALYVSGSEVSPCSAMEARRDAEGCCMVKTYDRCLPSVIAFQARANAERFAKEHGGQVIGFGEIDQPRR